MCRIAFLDRPACDLDAAIGRGVVGNHDLPGPQRLQANAADLLANEAGARTLCLFHHDPGHDDEFMDDLATKAANARPGTIAARDGLTVDL